MSGNILIVDSSETHRALLRAQLEAAYFTTVDAPTGEAAMVIAQSQAIDVILLNVDLRHGDGIEACRLLKAKPGLAHIPIVLMAEEHSASQRVRGFEAGADDFLSKPVNAVALFARMRSLARFRMMTAELRLRDATSVEFGLSELSPETSDETGCKLAIIARDQRFATDIAAKLSDRLGVRCYWLDSGVAAMGELRADPPDGYLICSDLPDAEDNYALCAALTHHRDGAAPAVIMMTKDDDLASAARCLDHGASDYVAEPFDLNELAARVRSQLRRKLYAEKLREFFRNGLRMSITDPLTGLYNRRYVDLHLTKRFEAARAGDAPLTVLVFDIDRFKRVNDRFGHSIGDQALRVFASRLRRNLRDVDMIARIGGEEFLAALPGVSLAQGFVAAERMRHLAAEPMPGAPRITVSAGVATICPEDLTPDDLMQRADRALYQAKSGGRNCVIRDIAA